MVRACAGIDLLEGSVPDESTILAFRHLLEEKKLAEKIFKVVNQHLADQGLLMRKRTVVDAMWCMAMQAVEDWSDEGRWKTREWSVVWPWDRDNVANCPLAGRIN